MSFWVLEPCYYYTDWKINTSNNIKVEGEKKQKNGIQTETNKTDISNGKHNHTENSEASRSNPSNFWTQFFNYILLG